MATASRLAVRKQFARDSPALVQPGLLATLYMGTTSQEESPDTAELETKLLQVWKVIIETCEWSPVLVLLLYQSCTAVSAASLLQHVFGR